MNGYKKGDTISIRRPVDYTLRTGEVMNTQQSIEGKVELKVDQVVGVDLEFSNKDMTLSIDQFDERFLKSAMSTIVNGVALDCMQQFLPQVYNYVGTPNTVVDSFADFMLAIERANHMALPQDGRSAIFNPTDHARMVGSLNGIYLLRYDTAYDNADGAWVLLNPEAVLADMAQSTIKGRAVGAGTGAPTDLTAAQAAALVRGGGAAIVEADLSTLSSFTLDHTKPSYQYGTNSGAFTLTAPASDCAVDLLVTNGSGAGAITFSGFTVGTNTGDALTTTNGHKFIIMIRRINGVSSYSIQALQ